MNLPSMLPCRLCSEDATIVEFAGVAIVRVRRKTKCKRFTPKRGTLGSDTCRTEECQSAEEAVAAWNEMQSQPIKQNDHA